MFGELRQQVEDMGETVQVMISSDKMKPSLGIDENGDRVFSLTYDGDEYPCLKRGWMSWAQKVLIPEGDEARERHGMVDGVTGRRRRWSTTTIQRFLEMTPIDIAQEAVTSWWERHNPTQWSVIKYKDNGNPGAIRFIGTSRYRLYRHDQFLDDLSNSRFSGMEVQDSFVNENRMVVRVTDRRPLEDLGKNVFAGYHLMNSENGSTAIILSHMIYDLLCTNGMMEMFKESKLLSQKHTGFDMEDFRGKVDEIAQTMDELHEKSLELVRKLVSFRLEPKAVDAVLQMYGREYDASKFFLKKVSEVRIKNLWQLVSAITNKAQDYSWESRLIHEANSGRLLRKVLAGKHLKYMKEEGQEESENGRWS